MSKQKALSQETAPPPPAVPAAPPDPAPPAPPPPEPRMAATPGGGSTFAQAAEKKTGTKAEGAHRTQMAISLCRGGGQFLCSADEDPAGRSGDLCGHPPLRISSRGAWLLS